MIVLADDPFFAADVERAEDFLQVVVVARLARNRQRRGGGRLVDGVADDGRTAFVEEVHFEPAYLVVRILQNELIRRGELAYDRGLDAFRPAQCFEGLTVMRGNGENHSLL